MASWEEDLATELEQLGEDKVRSKFEAGDFKFGDSSSRSIAVRQWLESKASRCRSEREEETLSIARSALANSEAATSNSRRANINAIIAMILSTIAAICSAIIGVYK